MPPDIDFDPDKDAANLAKYGLSLARAAELLWDSAIVRPDTRQDYGEPRFRADARLGDRLHMAVFTPRAHVLRIISLRKANRREVARYG